MFRDQKRLLVCVRSILDTMGKKDTAQVKRLLVHVGKDRQRTRRSFGVFRWSGSFNRQLFTNSSAALGNLPSEVNFGAGSLTMCCSSSRMLIVIPPPWRLTPLLFLRLRFFSLVSSFFLSSGTGRDGESVPSKSDRSESSSDADSENGNRPSASSISEIPRDHTSDLTVYCAPCIRSGYGTRFGINNTSATSTMTITRTLI